jgi:hypothetical protein
MAAADAGLVKALDYVVVVQRLHEDFCVKIVGVNETGRGIMKIEADF